MSASQVDGMMANISFPEFLHGMVAIFMDLYHKSTSAKYGHGLSDSPARDSDDKSSWLVLTPVPS
jgi:hypothetical protein